MFVICRMWFEIQIYLTYICDRDKNFYWLAQTVSDLKLNPDFQIFHGI